MIIELKFNVYAFSKLNYLRSGNFVKPNKEYKIAYKRNQM